jgi:hypothetical protein
MSDELWAETFVELFKHQDDERYGDAFALEIWLAGIGRIPGRYQVCEKRAKLMWDLRKHAIAEKWLKNKILLVGNSDLPLRADLGSYDFIGVFNNPRKMDLLRYATQHFCRSDKKDLSHHGGEELLPKHTAQVILFDGGQHAKDIQKREAKDRVFLANCRTYATDYPAAGLGKAPSTGYGAIRMYQKWGWDVTIACFSWEGIKVHDWDYELKSCLDMQKKSTLFITDSKFDPTRVAFKGQVVQKMPQAKPGPNDVLQVKKPCGCKDKKVAK